MMPSPGAAAILEADRIAYRYGRVQAVSGLSLAIQPGERIAVIGANGSGKSTLLRIFDGLLFPDAGAVRFDGRPLSGASLADDGFSTAFRRRVALLFQDPDAQLFNPTVFDELAFGPMQLGWSRKEVTVCVEQALEAMRIQDLRDRPPYQLSGGEKKRVALASIMVLDPEVFLLDEPTAAMDPKSQDQFLEFLCDLPRDRTVVIATHDLDVARHTAARCCVMAGGGVAAQGPVETILGDRDLLEHANLVSRWRSRQAIPPSGGSTRRTEDRPAPESTTTL